MPSDLFKDLLGKPYELGGRGPATYDCFGLLIEVCRRVGINLPEEQTNLTPEENHLAFLRGVQHFKQLPGPQDNCMVLLSPNMRFSNHCGFVLKYPQFIHVMEKRNVVIERLDSMFWSPRVKGFYL